jgi:hypothetical protein
VQYGWSDYVSGGCMMQSANVNVDTKIYAPLLKKCASGKGRAGVTNQLQCEGSLPLCLCEPNLLAVNSRVVV